MHAAIVRLLLYEDYVWVSLGNAMKAKQSKAKYVFATLGRRSIDSRPGFFPPSSPAGRVQCYSHFNLCWEGGDREVGWWWW